MNTTEAIATGPWFCTICNGQIAGGSITGWQHLGPAELGHGATADAEHQARPQSEPYQVDTVRNMDDATIGSVVHYSDRANYSTYVVIGIDRDDPWNPYKLRDTETFEVTATDGRQAGWKVLVV